MPIDIKKGFDDQDYLWDIRRNLINPITVKVASLEDKMEAVYPISKSAFTLVDVNLQDKELHFHSEAGGGVAVLDGMFREGSDLAVEGGSGTPETEVTKIKYVDATVSVPSKGSVEVSYNWPKLIADNQVPLQVGTIAGGTKATKHLFFRGVDVLYSGDGISTVDIPKATSGMTAAIPSKGQVVPVKISHIELEGEADSSVLEEGKLTIHINKSGGGVAPIAEDNFKGFFESFGDLEDQVKDPVNGKSYAFVRDTQLGGKYYTPHFYVGNAWKEFKQDPALTYSGPSDPMTHGVFSVKPSEKIIVDANGQLDLDGLSTPQVPSHFKGFFTSIADLKAAVPNPVLHQDWAYVNSANNGWLAYRSDSKGTARLWNVFAPLSSFALINRKDDPAHYNHSFGIYKNDSWDIDEKGILSLKPIDTKTKIAIIDAEGNADQGEIDYIQFMSGKSYATLQGAKKDRLFLNHPQRVISYTSDFEMEHNKKDYEGNIFYDENSRTWMGWGIPKAASGVDNKWTRIAHPKMSDEVKDLSKRLPKKSPSVADGILGDSRLWDYNGVTYVESDSETLPEELKGKCGAYVTTSIQDKDAEGVTIPQYRLQTLVADRDTGGSYVRRWKSTSTPGSSVEWSDWVRTSFSPKDIEDHNKDAAAHSETFKHYRAVSFSANLINFAQQVEGNLAGGVRSANCDLMFDSHSSSQRGDDYLDVPYKGRYRIKANFAISGYKEGVKTFPTGRWQALIRIKKKASVDWRTLGQFIYDHTDKKEKFPILDCEVENIDMDLDDMVIINLTFGGMATAAKEHPDLAFIPIKSYILIEDVNTHTGFYMCKTYSKHFATVDSSGSVGIRVHHANIPDPSTNIRVYGEKINKVPVEMQKVS